MSEKEKAWDLLYKIYKDLGDTQLVGIMDTILKVIEEVKK